MNDPLTKNEKWTISWRCSKTCLLLENLKNYRFLWNKKREFLTMSKDQKRPWPLSIAQPSSVLRQIFSHWRTVSECSCCVILSPSLPRTSSRTGGRMAAPASPGLLQASSFGAAKRLPAVSRSAAQRARSAVRASASDATKYAVLKAFRENRALKVLKTLCGVVFSEA
jgi:hypothetical protein